MAAVLMAGELEISRRDSAAGGAVRETGGPVAIGDSSGYGTSPGEEGRARRRRQEEEEEEAGLVESEAGSNLSGPHRNSSRRVSFHAPGYPQIRHSPARRKVRLLREAVAQTRGLDSATRRHLMNAEDFIGCGNFSEAIRSLEEGLRGARRQPRLQSLIWMLLGHQHMGAGGYQKASVCLMHYLAFCREQGDFPGITKAECSLGIVYLKLGLLKLAGRCFLQYLDNCQVLRDSCGVALAYSNLGVLSKMMATEGYRAARSQGDWPGAKEAMRVHLRRAIVYFEHHLDVVEQHDNLEMQSRCYGNLGACYEVLREFPQAIFCHNKRLETARLTGNRKAESCALCNLGNCFRASGKPQEAVEYYLLNLELARATDNVSGERVSVLNLGITCELLNQLHKAIEWHTLYLSMVVEGDDLPGQARGYSTLARLYEETQQMTKAQEFYRRLVLLFQRMHNSDGHAAASQYLHRIRKEMELEKLRQKKRKKRKNRKTDRLHHDLPLSSAGHPDMSLQHRPRIAMNRMGSWAPPTFTPHSFPPHTFTPHGLRGESTVNFENWLVFENPLALDPESEGFHTLAAQPGRVYCSQPVSQGLFEQETSYTSSHCGTDSPFYSLGDIMASVSNEPPTRPVRGETPLPDLPVRGEPPLPDLPSSDSDTDINRGLLGDDASLTDYESISGEPLTVRSLSHPRHIEELQRVGQQLIEPANEPGLEDIDKEWQQWLTFQENMEDGVLSHVGSLNMDMGVFEGPTLSAGAVRPNVSAPQSLDMFWHRQQSSSPTNFRAVQKPSNHQATAL